VSIAAGERVEAEAIKEQQRTESVNIQKEVFSWLLKRKMQGKIVQEIQQVETTNAKLQKAGYPETPLTTSELCEILGVDGIITSNFQLAKPMSDGAAMAMQAFTGAVGTTNQISVSITITDCTKSKMIWNYSHKHSGSMGSTPSQLVDNIMRAASKKMPYVIK
jgi:hypothetical protein